MFVFVLSNSVIVAFKFVVVVSKSFEVTKPFQFIKIFLQNFITVINFIIIPLNSFLRLSSTTFSSWPNRCEFATIVKQNLSVIFSFKSLKQLWTYFTYIRYEFFRLKYHLIWLSSLLRFSLNRLSFSLTRV